MSRSRRMFAFGSAAAVAVAGVVCAIVVPGLTGEVLTIGLVGLGLGAALLLVFYEIGLSEERAIAAEEPRGPEARSQSRPRR